MAEQVPRRTLTAFAVYLAISVAAFGARVGFAPRYFHVGFGADPSALMWCLVWWPHAIAHRLNPFVTSAIWTPSGFNLTWATSVPAVALVLAPFTLAFGPVASYNLAALAAPALSAWTMFLLCRRITRKFWPALAGGFLYGFSPYELGHLLGGHLSLTVNFVPPLCVLVFLAFLEGTLPRSRFVLYLAGLLILQCLISSEILATMTVFGAIALAAAAALTAKESRRCLRAATVAAASAYVLAALILSPFLYYALADGAALRHPLFPATFFSADLLNFVIPSPLMLFAPRAAADLTARFSGNLLEDQFYLGLPMLLLAGLYFWPRRNEPSARLLILLLAAAAAAALGPILHVAGRPVAPTPWAPAYYLPLLKNALPVRFATYGFLLLSPSHYDEPPFFAEGLYRKVLHPGDNLIVLPYGPNGPSMLWQAQSWMYFNMAGGYIGPTPDPFRRWPFVNAALFSLPLNNSKLQTQAFVAAHRVDAIAVVDGAASASELTTSLGIAPVELGGVSFYKLPPSQGEVPAASELNHLELEAANQWTNVLIRAAESYLAAGNRLDEVNPAALFAAGLLPPSKWAENLEMVLAGTSHGAINGLWVGPGPSDSLAIGLFASPVTAALLNARFDSGAVETLYPYPRRYTPKTADEGETEFMLVAIHRDFARRLLETEPSSAYTAGAMNDRAPIALTNGHNEKWTTRK